MTLHQQDSDQQIALLIRYYSRLASLLQQSSNDTALVASREIEFILGEIVRIEIYLSEHDVQLEVKAMNDLFLSSETIHATLGDVVVGDKIIGDKVEGDKQVISNYILEHPKSSYLHQLPSPKSEFVGREEEINEILEYVKDLYYDNSKCAIICINGMPGVGKSELAYFVANQLISLYPDAQIVIELFGASINPSTSEEALQKAIRAFGEDEQLPDDLHELQRI